MAGASAAPSALPPAVNRQLAELLRQYAGLLEVQGASSFRVEAYRRAASTLDALVEDLRTRFERGGIASLRELPQIGPGIAAALAEMLQTGRWTRLEALRGALDPPALFQTVPGVGPALARRIAETLHLESLEELEIAAHDGRLQSVAGVGERRAAGIRASLAQMLGRRRVANRQPLSAPPVELLLELDARYRHAAQREELPRIAPRRFNPEGAAWLPVLHTDRGEWHFSVMYSNTARAHQLGRTQDWVVIYFFDREQHEGQATVVTESRGALATRRVVRGRESECLDYYAGHSPSRES
ncbi:MAG: DNA-binding protein [Deltaproteobacteria bacterium]|nr:DNA-binding protein [Deltaproteobacteria bacterium]